MESEQALQISRGETTRLVQEAGNLRRQSQDLKAALENSEKEALLRIQSLESAALDQSGLLQEAQENYQSLEQEAQTALARLQGLLEKASARGFELETSLAEAQKALLDHGRASSRSEGEIAGLRDQLRIQASEFRSRETLSEDLQRTAQDLETRLCQEEESRRQSMADYGLLAARYHELEKQVSESTVRMEVERAGFVSQLEILQNRIESLEIEHDSVLQKELGLAGEIQEALRSAGDWKTRSEASDRELNELKQVRSGHESLLSEKKRQLEERERDLETMRRQVRDLTVRLEQRDVVYKREQLGEQVSLKEERLKLLVSEQAQFESEMRQKEEKMRAILVEQENIEKELVEIKQAQRHYLEQARRDKSGPAKLSKLVPLSNSGKPPIVPLEADSQDA